jgi:predicted dehydrogenase
LHYIKSTRGFKKTVKETGKIWSVNFSERFHVAAVAKAEELVNDGKIGKVKQTIGTGPHRQGNYERPNWFYDRDSYGGIITDIGSHQIHQFLVFTNSNEGKDQSRSCGKTQQNRTNLAFKILVKLFNRKRRSWLY